MSFSLWKDGKLGRDFEFFDRTILEQFNIGGVDIYVHKYLGAANANVTSTDATMPNYPNQSAENIGDLLFQETPNRVYENDIRYLRGVYTVSDLDLDLSQFGLMIAQGTLFITFHMKNMVEVISRKLMAGDVLELPNLKEFYALDEDNSIPVALKRYYVIQDGTRPAAGFSPTWWPHLWRVKCIPMVDAQEFSDILDQPVVNASGNVIVVNGNVLTYGNIDSTGSFNEGINAVIVEQAQTNVPASGYDTTGLWSPLFVGGDPKNGTLPTGSSPQQKWSGYLVGNGEALDGYSVTPATSFPSSPAEGQYILRQDYFPARLYRWNGVCWQYVNNVNKTQLTPGTGQTQRDLFINNANTFINSSGNSETTLQDINTLFRPDEGGNN